MPTSTMLSLLFPCCIRGVEDDNVIPNENSRLIQKDGGPPFPGLPNTTAVDQQKLNDRLGTIVRSKEGKMVNLGLRMPFTLQSAEEVARPSPTSPTSAGCSAPAPQTDAVIPDAAIIPTSSAAWVSRPSRPLVLTMTPAHSRTIYTDSRYSSPSGSRSSSRRRQDTADRYAYSAPSSDGGSGHVRWKQPSERYGDRESDPARSGVADAAPTRAVPIASPLSKQTTVADNNTQSIAFSWGDT